MIAPARNVLLLLTIGATAAGAQDEFAYDVPSAVIEYPATPNRASLEAPTRVVVLGTGTPIPDARRAGPGIAVIHRGQSYLFDIGAGVVRNATIARYRHDIPSLYPLSIGKLFITHMHSDHTIDYPELAFNLWWRRTLPLQAWGPDGLAEMSEGMYAMMAPDIRTRTGGNQPVTGEEAYRVDVTEISEGVVFEADDIRVEAFAVEHGDIRPAFGYRITTHDRTIVISGDTAPSDKLAEIAAGADLLFHEVISDSGLMRTSEFMQNYHRKSHTIASELGRLASRAKPGKLVLYHGLWYGLEEDVIVDEVRQSYDGDVVLARDLDVY